MDFSGGPSGVAPLHKISYYRQSSFGVIFNLLFFIFHGHLVLLSIGSWQAVKVVYQIVQFAR